MTNTLATQRMASLQRWKLWTALALLVSLSACALPHPAPPTRTSATEVACGAFEPITYSTRDTPETVAQVREHNAAWDALCKEPRP